MTKRLFLFAAYDKENIIDETLVHYIKQLSLYGDIIFVMDNDVPHTKLNKITGIKNVLSATAIRHNEYDFGSYKRGYVFAKDNKILNKYDWLYFVNDSVYGPLSSLQNILLDLESRGVDEVGMVENAGEFHPSHIQSWFVGFSKNIFTQPFFDEFITNVVHEDDKLEIITKYEVRLSRLISRHGFKMSALMKNDLTNNIEIYRYPVQSLIQGVPFIKKSVFDTGIERCYLNAHTDFPDLIDQIYKRVNPKKVPDQNTKRYVKIFRLSFLSVPIFSVYKKAKYKEYKIFLFDKIPVFKFSK